MTDLRGWPGTRHRDPPLASPVYAVRAPLSAWLRQEGERARATGGTIRVLDVGCGVKPYYPFFAFADEYVGVDVESPAADLRGSVEQLPVDDGAFEIVLCNQVLEHADDPAQAVRELRRVTAPGGRVLASTHGVQVYHPAPVDLWRWTHEGLTRLFEQNADWSSLTVTPGSGTTACLGMLVSTYLDILARRAGARAAMGPVVAGLNAAARAIDGRFPTLREPLPGALFANLHVVAEVGP